MKYMYVNINTSLKNSVWNHIDVVQGFKNMLTHHN